jgi:beta-glucosidase
MNFTSKIKCTSFYIAIIVAFVSTNLIAQSYKYNYQNPDLSISERVDDLVSRMTLEEKAGQLMFDAPAIERLDVPAYNWWNECLHGVARNGKATVFPQAIGLAATFDPELMHRIGIAISDEARAKFNENRKVGYMSRYAGLTFWSPNVNLFRDPRWGRGQETYGEDPFLISRMGVSFVKGLQGDNPKYMKVAAMAKHYAVHSGPEKLRHEFDAVVSKYDLWNTYLPAFKALVTEAKVEGVMGAYNRTNGDACCAHPYLMTDVLRNKWGFKGYYVSDCWAIQDFYQGHGISDTKEQAAAIALNAGCNLNCGNTYPALVKAIEAGLTTEQEVDANLKQLLPTRFKLGLFDPVGSVPFDYIKKDVVRSQKHLDLTYEAARKSIVLLKNKNKTLPLDSDIKSVYVAGPTAANIQALLANYYGLSGDMRTILEGIVDNVSEHTAIRYVQGGLLDRPNVNPMDWFSEEAGVADVTIACMGITQLLEGEEGEAIASPSAGDRDYITLPPNQIAFLKLLRKKAEGKKLIVVLTGGSAISIPEVYDLADAILYVWYPGEQGGQAIGDMIFGKTSPSGKLPVSFVKSMEDLPPYEDYNMENRTYRYAQNEMLFPFGFGLSYTQFDYKNMRRSSSVLQGDKTISVSVEISNTKDQHSEEVVQLYISKKDRNSNDSIVALKGIKRISLFPNETKTVTFELDRTHFSSLTDNGDLQLEKGNHTIYLSSSLPNKRSLDLGAAKWVESEIIVK